MIHDIMDLDSDDDDDVAGARSSNQRKGGASGSSGDSNNNAVAMDSQPPPQASTTTTTTNGQTVLDCYPYSFSPLLLFCPDNYFDKGHSNYNAVESFFHHLLPPEMGSASGHKVLFERKNMTYEQLWDYIVREQMLVTCCIDDHFTAFQILHQGNNPHKPCLIYYDPMNSNIQLVTESDSVRKLALFFLLKCNYGDSQHVQDNKGYYVGNSMDLASLTPSVRRLRQEIYRLWNQIHQIRGVHALRIKMTKVPLVLQQYLLINDARHYNLMSTQQTGNTCYFQVFLYVYIYIMAFWLLLLCAVCWKLVLI